MNVNKVLIAGRLTRGVELKELEGGTKVAKFSVATNNYVKDGEDTPEYHSIVVWNKTAENCEKYLEKGQVVFVEGRIQTRSWEKDGETKYSTEIVAQNVQFGAKAGAGKSNSETVDKAVENLGF
jgi:single-strand DNA-binding protein